MASKPDLVVTITARAIVSRRVWIKGARDAQHAEAVAREQIARSDAITGGAKWKIAQVLEEIDVAVQPGVTESYPLVVGEIPPGRVDQPPVGYSVRLDMSQIGTEDIRAITGPKKQAKKKETASG